MIKAIIFDCFGVLVGKGFHETYRQLGGDPAKDRQFLDKILDKTNLGEITEEQFHESIINRLGITPEAYRAGVDRAEQPDTAVLNYITSLRKSYKTALLSNANTGALERRLGADWLEKCFDKVIVSAEVGYIKPQPEIYRIALKELGVSASECIFVDDKTEYCEAARSLGMSTIWFRDLAQMKTDLEKILSAVPDN